MNLDLRNDYRIQNNSNRNQCLYQVLYCGFTLYSVLKGHVWTNRYQSDRSESDQIVNVTSPCTVPYSGMTHTDFAIVGRHSASSSDQVPSSRSWCAERLERFVHFQEMSLADTRTQRRNLLQFGGAAAGSQHIRRSIWNAICWEQKTMPGNRFLWFRPQWRRMFNYCQVEISDSTPPFVWRLHVTMTWPERCHTTRVL